MESPRSAKRRKLDTIPESPSKTRASEQAQTPTSKRKIAGARTNGTAARVQGRFELLEKNAQDATPPRDVTRTPSKNPAPSLHAAMTPSKPATPRPPPGSASKTGGSVSGLMKRLNAKLAEQEQLKNSPSPKKKIHVQSVVADDLLEDSSAENRNNARETPLGKKLRDTFEEEQLARAAKRKPKKTLEDQMRDIAEESRREVENQNGHAAVVAASPAPQTTVVVKRKPGRPRKNPLPVSVDEDILDDDQGPFSPSKLASARKLDNIDVLGSRTSLFTPKKAFSSPTKPRVLLDLESKPLPTNSSADLDISSDDLKAIQSAVLEQLQGRKYAPFIGLDDECAKIANLIDQTIVAGESNSMLLIGARGSGKTAIVESILKDQATKNPDLFHVIRLNGFIHTDDKIALRDIWRQLGREMELEEDAASKNYADTLTTLLALLSHPTELGQSADQVTKSVIFVLDEFDLFATHPRQTLLYNLFDIAQSRKAPIAVLGLTTRFDVAEQLEKRVKSRFSHRHVHFSLAKDLGKFRSMCQGTLTPVSIDEISEQGQQAWTAILNDIFTLETFNNHLRRLYYTSKSVPSFQTSMLIPISTLPTSSEQLITAQDILNHLCDPMTLACLAPPDTKLEILPSLSTLQLALLISAARLTIIHDTDTVTFALTYAEYVNLASRAKIAASAAGGLVGGGVARVWSKEVARGAWEGLLREELVLPEGKGEVVRVDVRLEEIGEADGVELGSVMAKWCREI